MANSDNTPIPTKPLYDLLEDVKDEKSFLVFVKKLIADRKSNEAKPINEVIFTSYWANNTISDFLQASVAWVEDSDFGKCQEPELKTNQWKQFALFLYCGKIYK